MSGPILLPSKPALKTDKVHMLDWGGPLTPQLGGAIQTLMRLGTRHSLDFTLPPMRAEPLGRRWSALLRMAKLYGAIMPFGQDGFTRNFMTLGPGSAAIVVDGAGQSGSSIKLRGLRPLSAVGQLGQAFSLIHGGRHYLHFVAEQTFADANGKMTLPIFPMLRVIPTDGDVCDFAVPMIQGSLSGNDVSWGRQSAPWFDFGTITITEDE